MKKLTYAILLTLALGLISASQAADTSTANTQPSVQSGTSSGPVAQSEGKHKKKHHHHHKKDKKAKEGDLPKT
jgi:hypothetical protein